MVVVGASGVFVVDTKAWREVAIDGARITRGQEDVTDDVAALADAAREADGKMTPDPPSPPQEHHG